MPAIAKKKTPAKKASAKKIAPAKDITLTVTIDTASAKWKSAFPKMKLKMETAAAVAFLKAKKPAAFKGRHLDVAVTLTDNKTIKSLNRAYRKKDNLVVPGARRHHSQGAGSCDFSIFDARAARRRRTGVRNDRERSQDAEKIPRGACDAPRRAWCLASAGL